MNYYEQYYNQAANEFGNNSKDQLSLAEPSTAFMRGNLFNNLYDPYKNYKPHEIVSNNEKDYALLLVQAYDFCAHELTLYLDNYPNNAEAIRLRDEYSKAAREAITQYENKYGPLNLSSTKLNNIPWAWDTNIWPWEGNY